LFFRYSFRVYITLFFHFFFGSNFKCFSVFLALFLAVLTAVFPFSYFTLTKSKDKKTGTPSTGQFPAEDLEFLQASVPKWAAKMDQRFAKVVRCLCGPGAVIQEKRS